MIAITTTIGVCQEDVGRSTEQATEIPVKKQGVRASFLDRQKKLMLAIPPDLDSTVKLTLVALSLFAHDDWGGIYVGVESLMRYTGLPRSTQYHALEELRARGIVVNDGFHPHPGGTRTRRRRIDWIGLMRDHRMREDAKRSPTDGTMESPTDGTQTRD
jgi:hypothetical protein